MADTWIDLPLEILEQVVTYITRRHNLNKSEDMQQFSMKRGFVRSSSTKAELENDGNWKHFLDLTTIDFPTLPNLRIVSIYYSCPKFRSIKNRKKLKCVH
jgi:hypothetical protein